MKILIVSDTHYYNDYLQKVTETFKDKVDLMVHCGDSSLEIDHPLLKDYLTVQGNHDLAAFPIFIIHDQICITHGQHYNIYYGYDDLVDLCKKNNCLYCFHGHTHVPTHQIHQGIHFINPGSLMMNRGQYGFGTFAIADINDNQIEVHFYHHDTFEQSDFILEEGLELLEEFKSIIKSK